LQNAKVLTVKVCPGTKKAAGVAVPPGNMLTTPVADWKIRLSLAAGNICYDGLVFNTARFSPR
jgi:hypothetical protein